VSSASSDERVARDLGCPALDVTALDVTALDVTALDVTALDVTALDVTALDDMGLLGAVSGSWRAQSLMVADGR
jgi:hypothetical protein